MPSPYRIRHQGRSSLAGTVTEIAGAVLRIGRRADNDVVFNRDVDLLVSGHHAEIRVDGTGPVLRDVGSTNGTFVNGTRVTAPRQLAVGDRIQLGIDGPVMILDGDVATGPTSDTAAPTLVGDVARAPQRAEAAPSPAHVPAPVAAPAPPRAPAPRPPHTPPPARATPPAAPAPQVPSGSTSAPPAAGPGLQTIVRRLDESNRSRRRLGWIGACAFVACAAAVGWVWLHKTDAPPPAPPAPERPRPPDWHELSRRAEQSVYLCIRRQKVLGDVVEEGFGTAWSVAPGRLATNAHVAGELADKENGKEYFARTPTSPPKTLRLIAARAHPGYDEFAKLGTVYRPIRVAGDGSVFRDTVHPFDVALMEVAPEDVPNQGPPIEIASDEELLAVGVGSEVGSFGFPMEGRSVRTDPRRPSIRADTGKSIASAADPWGDTLTAGQSPTFGYNLHVTGGASGSPVLARSGKVIGLISAGNVQAGADGQRVFQLGDAFGPRADLVRDMLAGRDTTEGAARAASLERGFRDRFREGLENRNVAIAFMFRPFVADVGRPSVVAETIETLEQDGLAGAKEHVITVDQAGRHAVAVFALDEPFPPSVAFRDGPRDRWQVMDRPESYYFVTKPVAMRRGGRLYMRVHVESPPRPFAKTRYAVTLVRFGE